MIKKLKNFICRLFNIKSCKCDDVDEHIEYFTKTPEPEIKVHVDPCPTHRYFKPKCHMCVAHAKGINL